MNVCVVGTGYVGLVTGACFAEFGVQVVCADKDEAKIAALRKGEIPIYEPGLEDIVERNLRAGRLSFTTSTAEAVRASLVVFIAVSTPARPDGSTDLTAVEAVSREIGKVLDGYKVIVTKSTVPVGTSVRVRNWIAEEQDRAGESRRFSVASNPEFLREGAAIGDFMRPDRVVIGTEDDQAVAILKDLYRPLYLNETPVVLTDVPDRGAHEVRRERVARHQDLVHQRVRESVRAVGADVQAVARAVGLDRRIGPKFLHAGPGFGGSCFPKDTRSVAHFAQERGERLEVVEAVIRVNQRQRERMIDKIVDALGGDLQGKSVGVLGLSFKPETDDMRDAPSIDIVQGLLERGAYGARVRSGRRCRPRSRCCPTSGCARTPTRPAQDADALVIVTEWNQFRMLDLERVKCLLRAARHRRPAQRLQARAGARGRLHATSESGADEARGRARCMR